MFNIIKKDFFVVKKQIILSSLLISVMCIVILLVINNDIEGKVIIYLLPWLMTNSILYKSMQSDEKQYVVNLYKVMPIPFSKIVLSKLLLSLFSIIYSIILILIILFLSNMFGLNSFVISIQELLISLFASYFFFSLTTYLFFRFGLAYVQYSVAGIFFIILFIYKYAVSLSAINLNILLFSTIIIICSLIFSFYMLSVKALRKEIKDS